MSGKRTRQIEWRLVGSSLQSSQNTIRPSVVTRPAYRKLNGYRCLKRTLFRITGELYVMHNWWEQNEPTSWAGWGKNVSVQSAYFVLGNNLLRIASPRFPRGRGSFVCIEECLSVRRPMETSSWLDQAFGLQFVNLSHQKFWKYRATVSS